MTFLLIVTIFRVKTDIFLWFPPCDFITSNVIYLADINNILSTLPGNSSLQSGNLVNSIRPKKMNSVEELGHKTTDIGS